MAGWTEEEYKRLKRSRACVRYANIQCVLTHGHKGDCLEPAETKRKPRIQSTPTVCEGITFQSEREAKRYRDLRTLENVKAISKLRLQVPIPIVVNRVLICQYVADFVYIRDGVEVIEDAKGFRTEIYKMKKKLMLAVHGIEILET